MGIFLLVVGLVLFIGLVVLHELGHFWAARRGGVDVEEFGIFFPPRIWGRKTKAGYDFTVNLLPLGGFVKLKGEHDSDTEPGSFGAAPDGVKFRIMLAGVFMNLVTALALFTALAWLGMPQLVPNQFTIKSDTHIVKQQVLASYVVSGSAAEKAGLQPRDQLVSIGGSCSSGRSCTPVAKRTLLTGEDLRRATKDYQGKTVVVTYKRGGETRTTTANLLSNAAVEASRKTDNPQGHLGIDPAEYTVQRSTWSAPVVAVGLSAQLTTLTMQGLGHALQGLGGIVAGAVTGNTTARTHAQTTASEQVSGPVGIYAVLKAGSMLGVQYMLMIIAVISLTLAIMNVLPIPALDGGRLFVMLISRITRKPITPKVEEAIYGAGFVVLIGLIVLITIVDVKRFF